ncbi:lysine-specific histone demethylase 1B-like [Coregonus clupeaformis]|uniref:lysine-specific histone demethylase 1B-like n=1 Tax=Coregonus clupeaformis TaxID=59861 RepID=UPI001BE02C10|nr:lysine-specific histone demethylase 1B-like [Coregonus clupeaformis]
MLTDAGGVAGGEGVDLRACGTIHRWACVTVGREARIVNGCVNNPIALMSEQLSIKMHKLGERCDLFQEGGRATDPAIDNCMDFNAILDMVSEWRKDKSQNQDTPLGGATHSVYEMSARSLDHNEFFAQFSGDHTLMAEGYSSVLNKLAEGLDIRIKSPVSHLRTMAMSQLSLLPPNVCTCSIPFTDLKGNYRYEKYGGGNYRLLKRCRQSYLIRWDSVDSTECSGDSPTDFTSEEYNYIQPSTS